MKLLNLLFIVTLCSCSTGKSRHKVTSSQVYFKGGVSEGKSWTERLNFKRNSWYRDIKMTHDVLLTELSKNSPFLFWMKSNRTVADRCEKFGIALLYSSSSDTNTSFLKTEIEKSGFEIVSVPNFRRGLKSHYNFKDWRLGYHQIVGICTKLSKEISITVPGHKIKKISF